ncbi:MAG: hypothetical protein VKJ64_02470 [Leptolyngbyaceae bacterium]|nr:hypothetical protein [Leptolyngbyaceae bacterium]
MIECITLGNLTHGTVGHVLNRDSLYSLVLVATMANSPLFWQWWIGPTRDLS